MYTYFKAHFTYIMLKSMMFYSVKEGGNHDPIFIWEAYDFPTDIDCSQNLHPTPSVHHCVPNEEHMEKF